MAVKAKSYQFFSVNTGYVAEISELVFRGGQKNVRAIA
jgi:hypothetical protein